MTVSRDILDQIIGQARAEAPNEACGYLAGRDGVSELAIPMRNADQSPEHYSVDPKEQFQAVKTAREAGLDLIAVYHSHPETPARMSEEDIRLAFDPNMVYLIYSLAEEKLKGFRVDREKNVIDVTVTVGDGEAG
jgi:proteasome lid subunit RPN8/RPN11